MHETINKRIFVGGLASEVTAGEITERFSRFGKVGNLSLKSRRDESGNVIKSFAHLDLEGDEANIKKCFNTYQNTKWKGSVLQLQYAKESFLQKLEKEREEAHNQQDDDVLVVKPSQTSQSQLFEVIGPAVPGTPVPGKKDWVVGKYGRVLPILKLKKSYKIRMVKHDPSKHCHAAKVFKDDKASTPTDTSCSRLTWEINTPDTEITKKRKGEFPHTSSSVKKIKQPVLTPSEYFKKIQITRKMEEVEVVKLGSGNVTATTKLIKSNRFDSDLESDPEGNSFDQNVYNIPQTGIMNQLHEPTAGSKTVKENTENLKLKASENRDNKNTVSQSTSRELPVSASVSENEPVTLGPKLTNGAKTSKSPVVKQKENVASAFNKISKFQGLGMLGLLEDCSRTCPEKLEETTNSSLSDYRTGVIVTSDVVDGIVSNKLRDRKNDKNIRKKIAAVSTIGVRNETLVRNMSQIKDTCDEDSVDRSFDYKKVFNVSEDNDEEEENSAVEEENDDNEEEDSKEEGSDDEEEENSAVEEQNDDNEEEYSEEEGSDDEEEYNSAVEEQNDDVEEENSAVEEQNDDNEEGSDDEEEENSSVEEEDNGNEEEDSVEEISSNEEEDSVEEDSDDEEKEDGEGHEDFEEEKNPSAGVDKKLGNTSGSLKVTHTLVGKTSFTSASEKFKNSKVPIIDMSALRFDPTKIQKPEAFTVFNTALSRKEGAMATSRHTNRNKEAIKNEKKHEGFQQSKLLPKCVRGQIKR